MTNLPPDKDTRAEYWNDNTNAGQHVAVEITPNVVISDSNKRFWLGLALYILGFLAAVAALFLGFFPEFNTADQTLIRAIAFTNAFISLAASTFGVVVTLPNVPRHGSQTS